MMPIREGLYNACVTALLHLRRQQIQTGSLSLTQIKCLNIPLGSATERYRNSHHNSSNGDHDEAGRPRTKSGGSREHIAAHEQHRDRDGVGNPERRPQHSSMNRNGMTTGMVERNTSRQIPRRPAIRLLSGRARCRDSGSLVSLCRIDSSSSRDSTETSGAGRASAKRAPAGFGIAGLPDRAQFQEAASPLSEAAHQIKPGVDDAPGQVAAQRAQDHGFDVGAPRGDHAERARAGQHHDQAEQNFGNPIDRIEPTKGSTFPIVRHCSRRPRQTIRNSERPARVQ